MYKGRYEQGKLVTKHTFIEYQCLDEDDSPNLRRHNSEPLLTCAGLDLQSSDVFKFIVEPQTPTTCASVNGICNEDNKSRLSSTVSAVEDDVSIDSNQFPSSSTGFHEDINAQNRSTALVSPACNHFSFSGASRSVLFEDDSNQFSFSGPVLKEFLTQASNIPLEDNCSSLLSPLSLDEHGSSSYCNQLSFNGSVAQELLDPSTMLWGEGICSPQMAPFSVDYDDANIDCHQFPYSGSVVDGLFDSQMTYWNYSNLSPQMAPPSLDAYETNSNGNELRFNRSVVNELFDSSMEMWNRSSDGQDFVFFTADSTMAQVNEQTELIVRDDPQSSEGCPRAWSTCHSLGANSKCFPHSPLIHETKGLLMSKPNFTYESAKHLSLCEVPEPSCEQAFRAAAREVASVAASEPPAPPPPPLGAHGVWSAAQSGMVGIQHLEKSDASRSLAEAWNSTKKDWKSTRNTSTCPSAKIKRCRTQELVEAEHRPSRPQQVESGTADREVGKSWRHPICAGPR